MFNAILCVDQEKSLAWKAVFERMDDKVIQMWSKLKTENQRKEFIEKRNPPDPKNYFTNDFFEEFGSKSSLEKVKIITINSVY